MLGLRVDPVQAVQYLLVLVLSITVHECAHAWSAWQLGDGTARRMGRLTLNPIVHFDPLGALMLLIMAFGGRGFGWGRPVPVVSANLRGNRRVGMGLTAGAGPFSNLVLACLAAIPLRLGFWQPPFFADLLWALASVNVSLAVFNLIPLPPLDGFHVTQGLLGTVRSRWAYEWGERLDRLAPYGPVLLLLLLSAGMLGGANILGIVLGPPIEAIWRLLLA